MTEIELGSQLEEEEHQEVDSEEVIMEIDPDNSKVVIEKENSMISHTEEKKEHPEVMTKKKSDQDQ